MKQKNEPTRSLSRKKAGTMPEVHREPVPGHIAKGDQKKSARRNRHWELPALRALLETILPRKAVFNV